MEPTTTAKGELVMAQLTMYSTVWCGYCQRLKAQLDREGISYDEVDVEDDLESAEYVMSVNGGNRVVPTVVFADGQVRTNPGINEVKSILGL
jgi:mycoredoxin